MTDAELLTSIAIVHAHTDAERAIVRGEWPFACPYCARTFQTADRWFPYCGPICGICAEEDL